VHDQPKARTEGIISEFVDDDVVVYDAASQTAHSLSAAVASVWEVCDGNRTAQQIADQCSLEQALVARAISELGECGLLDDGPLELASSGISRREAARRLAKVGGAALVGPLIYSVAVPAAYAVGSTACTFGPGTITNSTTCNATAGNTGTSTCTTGFNSCAGGVCYQGATGGILYCVSAGCVIAPTNGGADKPCTGTTPGTTNCCDPTASCTTGSKPHCSN
jgi:hypothetical protein